MSSSKYVLKFGIANLKVEKSFLLVCKEILIQNILNTELKIGSIGSIVYRYGYKKSKIRKSWKSNLYSSDMIS